MADLRIGVIGASRVARYAIIGPAREIDGAEIVAVAARDAERANSYAAELGIPNVFSDYATLFADPTIDLVYLGTPPSLHASQALAAIAAGKHVLVEKPFALTSAEAQVVSDFARERNVRVFEAMHSPHHGLFGRILEILKSGILGRLREIEGQFDAPIDPDDPFRWQHAYGGGALMDLGIYPLALVRRIAGEDFALAAASAVMRGDVDESFQADLAYRDGLTARISASMARPKPTLNLRLTGEQGTLTVSNPYVPQLGNTLSLAVGGRVTTETIGGPGSYAAQLAAVRATLVDGTPFPHRDDDFVRSLQAIEAIRARFLVTDPTQAD